MSYNKNINRLNKVHERIEKIQNDIINLIQTLELNNIKVKDEDVFIFNELRKKTTLDYNISKIILDANIMNYSMYLKNLNKKNTNIVNKILDTINNN